ncbi:catechol 2,3-dioxygenase-like lactoylglutathione lyase family enzyme [Cryobacterium sp. MP_M5]|uniref:VOC family protein n=1 Tax=unclassified Cryobacterium TaxID=2649013 RepID=UPI001A21F213|nr:MULTISPECIES: VOC family protein [unclassified Cryobacterium]MBG6058992.1 catechol 2,3-dioxygenase-like lactoylglutathione lyase family enzyme [Cryobacterium sp. MP_M3]MEC5178529.1 catechol 2,3-dioxygenase-like lactoylglutathione lyase family enzyme [Cryobacterium sp. MP_M5]
MPLQWSLEVVTVCVSDVDRAKQFYAEQVGFHLDLDLWVSDDQRVVQFTPSGSGCSIQLKLGETRIDGLQLVVSDVDAARAELAERGVDASRVMHFENGIRVRGRGEAWNSFVFFSDPDGNAWVVQERPAGI